MVIAKPSFIDRITSRKLWAALLVFVVAGLGGELNWLKEPEQAQTFGLLAPIIYMVIQGAIDWIKTKKVYEAQAAAAAVTGTLPAVVGAPTTGPDPHTAIAAG
jgi:hypothetical protein